MQFGLSNNFNDMTIDEPAKRLSSKQAAMTNPQIAYAIKTGHIPRGQRGSEAAAVSSSWLVG